MVKHTFRVRQLFARYNKMYCLSVDIENACVSYNSLCVEKLLLFRTTFSVIYATEFTTNHAIVLLAETDKHRHTASVPQSNTIAPTSPATARKRTARCAH